MKKRSLLFPKMRDPSPDAAPNDGITERFTGGYMLVNLLLSSVVNSTIHSLGEDPPRHIPYAVGAIH